MLERGPAKKLVVTVFEDDRWHGQPVYLALLGLLRHRGFPEAIVTRGLAGYRGGGHVHTANIVDLSAALPVRVEAVGSADAVDRAGRSDRLDADRKRGREVHDVGRVDVPAAAVPG